MERGFFMRGNFQRDLGAEQVLGKYLDLYYYNRNEALTEIQRVEDRTRQLAGIDSTAVLDGKTILIDEKGLLSKTKPIPTFAFELSYISPNGNRHVGWLFDETKQTDYYLLCWNKRDEHIRVEEITVQNLHYVMAMLVSRVDFIKYLDETYNINATTAAKKVEEIIDNGIGKRLENLSEKSPSRYHYSIQLPEKPINIVMDTDELLHSGAVVSYHLVKKSQLVNKLPLEVLNF